MRKQQTMQRQLSKRPDSSAGSVLAEVRGRAAMGQPQMQVRWLVGIFGVTQHGVDPVVSSQS
jgi:hypothetical protein